jgi:hypothetical protein
VAAAELQRTEQAAGQGEGVGAAVDDADVRAVGGSRLDTVWASRTAVSARALVGVALAAAVAARLAAGEAVPMWAYRALAVSEMALLFPAVVHSAVARSLASLGLGPARTAIGRDMHASAAGGAAASQRRGGEGNLVAAPAPEPGSAEEELQRLAWAADSVQPGMQLTFVDGGDDGEPEEGGMEAQPVTLVVQARLGQGGQSTVWCATWCSWKGAVGLPVVHVQQYSAQLQSPAT